VRLTRAAERARETTETDPNLKEIDMNAIVSSFYRDLTCAAAALLISVVIGASFVHSTAIAPGTYAAVSAAQAATQA
jgi:hypothetical protein